MYSLYQIKRAVANPIRLLIEANRLYHRRLYTRDFNASGIDIFSEDWDNLILLDACRYDMFEAQASLQGELAEKYSRGSSTVEFLHGNFSGRDLRDTVYVTANPQLYRYRDEIETMLHNVINVWQEDGWDADARTVLPETTTEYAKRAAEQYPDKRLVIHYIQPHYPFINSETKFDKNHLENPDDEEVFWYRIMEGELDVPKEVIWKAYQENLEIVLPFVETLLLELKGKTVVTSDHGNMVGERAYPLPIKIWGHPQGIYTEPLVKIPWLVSQQAERKRTTAEPSRSKTEDIDEGVVQDRLRDLGYVE